MKKLLLIAGILAVTMLCVIPASAQEPGETLTPLTAFNRDLVKKVEKGCIYIWAMSPGTSGFLSPRWIGSGVIFMAVPEEDAAYALTNHHVAQDTVMLQCEGWDRSTYKAQFVATEPGLDCALIRIENIPRDKYEPCTLGNSDGVVIGEPALAVGAPGMQSITPTNRSDPWIDFGLHQTTTMRVVSGRVTDPYELIGWWAGWRTGLGRQVLSNLPWRFITESPISGGNSGGPLFNSKGEVIGLNHAHMNWGPQATQHVNYAIPINFCKTFCFQILDTGKYELPWMGIDILMPSYFDDSYGVSEFVDRYLDKTKLEVYGIRRDSPAEQAVQVEDPNGELGLKKGDIIIEFDGRTFADVGELRMYAFTLPIGKEVPVTIKRNKREIDYVITVGVKRSYNSEFSI
jgi:S1-C subfamily serine protease